MIVVDASAGVLGLLHDGGGAAGTTQTYVALAEAIDCHLLTADARLREHLVRPVRSSSFVAERVVFSPQFVGEWYRLL